MQVWSVAKHQSIWWWGLCVRGVWRWCVRNQYKPVLLSMHISGGRKNNSQLEGWVWGKPEDPIKLLLCLQLDGRAWRQNCAEIFLSVYLGFWLHPTERLWWVKKVSSWSRSTAAAKPKENCSAVTEAIEGHCWCLCSCLKGCSFTFKLSSPSKY